MRLVWLVVGLVAVALAVAGAVLPLLPTTPFLILAAFCFARSSPRLEAKLLAHRRFGPLIRDWRAGGAISRPAKRVSLLAMAATPVVSWLVGVGLVVIAVQVTVLAAVAAFIVTRPEPG
jgi:uncharacterized membrane protein YbaN (DUF454 family)